MKEVEATGRTVEEAINRALAKLKVSRDEAEIDVVSEGSQGLFGMGTGEAKVIARVEEQPFTGIGTRAADAVEVTTQVIQDLVDRMDLDAGVEYLPDAMVTEDSGNESGMVFDVLGDDLGLLIGRHGQTLANFQYLVRILVAQKVGDFLPIVVDVNGYRQRRFKALEVLARRTAEQVRRRHMPFALDPMPAFERRIVHLVLANDPDVATQSVGVGDERKVVVVPKDESFK
ncbi:RNA-binding cell elongation regulator Jag/EloR [Dehalogenimonas etheniformans]|uniref:RNA-binding protein KhpB n=1 Tax=Dehalogenimonas etheniformans TaxID=1536648 RepID=A0A2P5P960_9CHLR|nr:RNA-binding cell elongation regulator Jag/EloR [Dehalogenimonas etheniformans]PPD58827.1 protein jag [Dehalogenimonas etheniformans]QNT76404.1 protein jag [Dehalogenimonas etheniformans]